jgi:hypothetical protein
MEVAKTTILYPIGTSNIGGLGRNKYWLIGVWSKFESPSIDFSGLTTLRFEGLGSTTWGALMLVIVCKPTPSSNVISLMSSTTILGGFDEWVHLYI